MPDTDEQLEDRIRQRDERALGEYLERKKIPLISVIERRLGADYENESNRKISYRKSGSRLFPI